MMLKVQRHTLKAITITFTLMAAFIDSGGQEPIRQSCVIQASATISSAVPLALETLQHMRISGVPVNEGIIYISPITSAQAGLMRITASPGTQLLLHYLTTDNLIAQDGNGYLTVRYELSGYHERLQQVSQPYYSGVAVFTTGSDGMYYLWLGGTIFTHEAVNSRYSGKFTIEIEYL